MKIAIHQPNFFPWYPFFEKIKNCDIFIILTHCQFEKNGYQNRFNFNNNWHTMSVKKGLEPIKDKVYLNPKNDWDRIKNKLPDYKFILNEFDDCIFNSLEKTNILIIKKLCKLLNIKTKIVMDYPTKLKSSDRLIDLCIKNQATEYFSGVGAKAYLNDNKFNEKNIKVNYQKKLNKKHVLEIL